VKTSQAASLVDPFERALGDILARVCVLDVDSVPGPIAVAYSGGLDSSVLLHLAHAYAHAHGIELLAFHIHHGISPNAEQWLQYCEANCARLGVRFDARRVTLVDRDTHGTEQAARLERYAALGALCRAHAAPVLLTAHHRDDQAETVLLQLLRGSGVAGMGGMELSNTAPDLLGNAELVMARPLLQISRAGLQAYADESGIGYINDESNADVRYARNALRHQVMPVVGSVFPGFEERLVRAAGHAQSAHRLLNELAASDLAMCSEGECIQIARMKALSFDRIDNLLRYWFSMRGIRMPSTAWLLEMRTQLLDAKNDARIRVTHADCEVRRHRDRIFITQRFDDADLVVDPVNFNWQGEGSLEFPSYGGSLRFVSAEDGFDADWLSAQSITLRYRHGGEKLKRASNRPTRALKYHYQSLGIPAWERERLPLVFSGNMLLFAAGLGMNWNAPVGNEGRRVRLEWQSA
jgi:tRNA(Ile)-lysidine synthase